MRENRAIGIASLLLLVVGSVLTASPAVAEDAQPRASVTPEQIDPLARHVSALSTALGPGLAAQQSPPACPDVITTNFRLSADLTCSLSVGAPNVTIDLGGHTLSGSIFEDPLAAGGHSGMVVRHGKILGNGYPTAILNISSHITLDRVEIRGFSEFAVQIGPDSTVKRSHFVDNGTALDLFWGARIKVVGSTFERNQFGLINGADNESLIKQNLFVNNDVGAFVWDEDAVGSSSVQIANNTFRANRIGLDVLANLDVKDLRVNRNEFAKNREAGIRVAMNCEDEICASALLGTVIVDNRASENGFAGNPELNDGIVVTGQPQGLAHVTLAKNSADRNADLGIDAQGVIDGRGNRARGNGNPLQCIGVSCR